MQEKLTNAETKIEKHQRYNDHKFKVNGTELDQINA